MTEPRKLSPEDLEVLLTCKHIGDGVYAKEHTGDPEYG